MIRAVKLSDAQALCDIYNEYVLNTRITFEELPITVDDMIARITEITKIYPWLVYEHEGSVVGYSYAGKWKERSAYRYSVEAGIYIRSNFLGKGIGTKLTEEVIKELRAMGIHSVICGIAFPNPASERLCEKYGFAKVAHFREVGFKLDQWVDVGYWQLIL